MILKVKLLDATLWFDILTYQKREGLKKATYNGPLLAMHHGIKVTFSPGAKAQ